MKGKLFGIFMLLVVLCVYMTFATATPWWDLGTSKFLTSANVMNLLSRISL